MKAQEMLPNCQDLKLPNDESAHQHELVCEIVTTSSNTKRSAIIIKEGEHLGHL